MRKLLVLIFLATFLLSCGVSEGVDRTVAVVSIKIEIVEQNAISILQQPLSLHSYINDRGETAQLLYTITATGQTFRSVTGRLEGSLPEGVQIFVRLDSPIRGISTGLQELGSQEVELLTGVWGIYGVRGSGVVLLKAANEAPRSLGHIRIRLAIQET
ncbi:MULTISPECIES: hypothetical protein [Aminobacterium]|jgi:hypothetical protein|uniref:Lipoprotein n=1 Tax=Aminobacterium colombiense (strain DSM 12261 / ALA-1) TaxID=572547 RepID=D5EHE6_AMICL|nr:MULTISPECIES: hypothetical protein [Aminobacterium]MDD2379527.1 hypothetical protein [Aminobacterium colombiense]ADE57978.1 hypothetical protein Amico_1865 [Aminobacterium colombiense DSM 12261]MDD3768025.1 hypothetical protein [Aminobacterium colombiense]MDD4266268.1 hypothetical protein [Aminobacterium colombiense]MDD4585226.1 hypothetical protein [Aminobacterium colombiense]